MRLDTTLKEARAWLRKHAEHGAQCPLCGRHVKIYNRKLLAMTGRILIEMDAISRRQGQDEPGWVYVPTLSAIFAHTKRSTGGDEAKARYWGLIEPYPNAKREDGSTRVGWWRLTSLGVQFVRNQIRVPKYARVYNGKLIELDDSQTVSIIDVLDTDFNYDDLMAGV